jgi:4-amino-4-deoxy-L-arabinose transferase-like glycosyltransferase
VTEPIKPRRSRAARSGVATAPPPADVAAVEPLPILATDLPLGSGPVGDAALDRRLTLPGVTLEAALYALLAFLSLLLRFWQLGEMPLSPEESRTAVAALAGVDAPRSAGEAGALLEMGNRLVFALAGATDASARFLPALIGGLLPLTLVWGRPLIGRGPAAIAAVLLALSPLQLDQSRAVSPGGIASTITLALAFVLFRYAGERRPWQLFAGALLLALGLTAGTPAFAGLLALGLTGLAALLQLGRRGRLPGDVEAAVAAVAPANGHVAAAAVPHGVGRAAEDEGRPHPDPLPEGEGDGGRALPEGEGAPLTGREQVARAGLIFLVTLAVVATGALTSPNALHQGLFAPLGAFLSSLAAGQSTGQLWRGPLTLLAYEPFALVLGAVGTFRAWRRGSRFELFLTVWLLLGLVAAFAAPQRSTALLAAAIVPATLLAARIVHRLVLALWQRGWLDYGIALGVLTWGVSLVLLGWGHASLPDPIGVRYVAPSLAGIVGQAGANDAALRVIAGLPALLLIGAVLWLWRREPAVGRPALALAAATVLWMGTLHAGWNLAYQAIDNVAELPRMEQSSVDARTLGHDVNDVLQVLSINRRDQRDVLVDESLRYPLAWYVPDDVRGAPVRFGGVAGTPALLIVKPGTEPPSNRYSGQRYRVSSSADLWFENAAQLWRWLIYRENPHGANGTDAMVFVRAQ